MAAEYTIHTTPFLVHSSVPAPSPQPSPVSSSTSSCSSSSSSSSQHEQRMNLVLRMSAQSVDIFPRATDEEEQRFWECRFPVSRRLRYKVTYHTGKVQLLQMVRKGRKMWSAGSRVLWRHESGGLRHSCCSWSRSLMLPISSSSLSAISLYAAACLSSVPGSPSSLFPFTVVLCSAWTGFLIILL